MKQITNKQLLDMISVKLIAYIIWVILLAAFAWSVWEGLG